MSGGYFSFLVAIVAMVGCPVIAAPGSKDSTWISTACATSLETSSYDNHSSTEPAVLSKTLVEVLETSSASTIAASEGLSLPQQLLLADSTADRFDLLPDNSQFIFDFNLSQGVLGDGGNLTVANRKTFPALTGTGAGMAVGRVGPCGLNTFHVHPRSAELQLVVEGRLVTAMVPENGVVDREGNRRVIKNEVGPFQMTPFYQGSIHTQFNPDCVDAIFVASFASEDFGTGQALDQIFAFPDDVVAAAFGQAIQGDNVDSVSEKIPTNIALGVEECLQRCGIEKMAR